MKRRASQLNQVSLTVPSALKAEANLVFARLGITPSQAVRSFYRHVVAVGALPWGSEAGDAQAGSAGPAVGIVEAIVREEAMNAQWQIPTSPMPSQSWRR
ncbi:MAG: type II toxin-antitoxin system RelB/DinJ family antitoxin [Rhizobiales bacterium]|nr:type II toxin-antitoxin system RelB/DinJ family antitoxin [Hyphomicrobiales bacterium]